MSVAFDNVYAYAYAMGAKLSMDTNIVVVIRHALITKLFSFVLRLRNHNKIERLIFYNQYGQVKG